MTDNIVKLFSKDELPLEFYEWLMRMEDDNFSEEDKAELKEWAAKNPEFASHFPAGSGFLELAKNSVFEKPSSLGETSSVEPTISRNWFAEYRTIAAAVALVMVSAASYAYMNMTPAVETVQMARYETLVGQNKTALLEDGTKVHLNSQTKILVRYSESSRIVEVLKGEAYFEVAKNPARPFTVKSDNMSVRAIGTIFNVEYLPRQKSAVTLIEGSIEVMQNYGQRKISSVILNTVGDQASVKSASLSSRNPLQNGIYVTQAKIDNVISWRSGVLIFTGEKLSTALYKMNLHSEHQITLKGSYLLNKPVFGVFTMGDWQQSLKAILSQYPLKIEETLENETILITDQNQKS